MISEIVSIDIGFQNAAWVHMDKDKKVLGWSRAEILKPKPYNPAVFRPLVSSCIIYFACKCLHPVCAHSIICTADMSVHVHKALRKTNKVHVP